MDYMPIQKCLKGMSVKELSDSELMAIVIGVGSKNNSVMNLSFNIIKEFGGLKGIYDSGIRELSSLDGIGSVKAIKILCSLELGKRIVGAKNSNDVLDSPVKVWESMRAAVAELKQEELYVFILDNASRLLKKLTISRGTVSETLIHPREIFKEAIKESATSIIIAHNHPSGNLVPSMDDYKITRRINEVGKILGIRLVDHLILTSKSYYSFRENSDVDLFN